MLRLIIVCILIAGHADLFPAPLRAGGFIVAPLVMGEPGRPLHGALRDYLEMKVVPQGVDIQWTPATSLPDAIEQLKDGHLDLVLVASGAIANTPGIAAFEWNYLYAQPHLAVRYDSSLRTLGSLTELRGMKIGWTAGYPLSPGLERSGAVWDRLNRADWQRAHLYKLERGKVDAIYFENEYSPQYYANATNSKIRLIRLPMPRRAFYMVYSTRSSRADIERFDRAAEAAFTGPEFRKFLLQYCKRNVRGSPQETAQLKQRHSSPDVGQ